jgi:hypothetical protein
MKITQEKKKNIVLFFFVVFVILFLISSTITIDHIVNRNISKQIPAFLVEPNMLDFQDVGEGIFEGTVYLVNRSDRKINLLFAKSSCSCTLAQLPVHVIHPQERIPLNCTLNTFGRKGKIGGVVLIAYHFDSNTKDFSTEFVDINLCANVISNGM